MEKIGEKIAALRPDANYFSLEFFPPKTQMVGYLLPRAKVLASAENSFGTADNCGFLSDL